MRIKLDIPLTLKEIAIAIGAPLRCQSYGVTHIVTDSRMIQKEDLFFALSGEKHDGNDFIKDAKSKGACTVGKNGDIPCSNTAHALLRLGAYYKQKLPKLQHTIAITGSTGKSTTKEILSSILSDQFKVHKTEDNFNNIIGVSYTLLSAPTSTEILILELGMNHKGEIATLSQALAPDIALITNIGTSHIGNLGSKEKIAAAKLEIKMGLSGHLVIPYDEPLLKNENGYRFSTSSKDADIYIERDALHKEIRKVYSQGVMKPYALKTDADHIAYNASAAFCVAELCNFAPAAQYEFLANSRENIRQKLIKSNNFDILCDYYNASLESFISGFKYVSSLSYKHKSALIGDVLELGEYTEDIHFKIGKLAAESGFERLFLFGSFAEHTRNGALSAGFPYEEIYINKNYDLPEITARQIITATMHGELIYAKASHKSDLGRITNLLKD